MQRSASQRWAERVQRNRTGHRAGYERTTGNGERVGGRRAARESSKRRAWGGVGGAVLGVIALVASLQLVYGFVSGFGIYMDVRRDLADTEAKLSSVQKANDELRQDIRYMKSGEFVEKEARRKLGFVRAGEVPVVVIHEDARQHAAPDVARRSEPPRSDRDLY